MNAINSNEQMIQKINEVLQTKKDAVVNIVNDKLTISVFSLLEKNLKNVKEINFVIRDVKFLPHQSEIAHEFEINPTDVLFNAYDITEKNKLQHFSKARSMHEFIEKIVVYAPDKSSGHRTQQIDICFRFNVAVATAVADSMVYDKKRKAA